jgi:serine-type anaerobic sulfatase-maturating enzyme
MLAKPTGAICDLDCEYCFSLSKEMLYPGSRFRMADDLLETYPRQVIESHARSSDVTVAWQGGEPTMMDLDFFRRSVELAERYRTPRQRIAYTIQMNATLIDDEWAAFFQEHGFLVGVSIDGPKETERARPAAAAGGTGERAGATAAIAITSSALPRESLADVRPRACSLGAAISPC